MHTPPTERETLVIPIAGIVNCGSGNLSTATVHFARMAHDMRQVPGVCVAPPVVPCGLGILRSLEETYKRTENEVLKLAKSGSHKEKQVVLVAHSLASIFAWEVLARHQPEDKRLLGAVALGGPFGGLGVMDYWPLTSWRTHQIRDFVENMPRPLAESEGGPQLVQVGSVWDMVVPASSALRPVSGTTPDLHLFDSRLYPSWFTPNDLGRQAARHQTMVPVDHAGLLYRKGPVLVATDAVTNMSQGTFRAHNPLELIEPVPLFA